MALLKHRSPCLLFALILLINKYAELAEAVSVEQGSNSELNTQARFNDTGLNETLLKVDAEEQPGDEPTEKVDDTQPRLVVRRVTPDMELDDEDLRTGNIIGDNYSYLYGTYRTQGHYLRIENHKGLRLIVKSPNKEQSIRAKLGVVKINGKTVCTDSRSLPTQPTYQKTPDGAMWYTNLSLGSPMSPKEIEEFKAEEELRQKKDRRRENKWGKSEKAAAKAERRARKRAQKELKRAVKLYEKSTRGSESESDDEDSDWDD
nr:PREDICTED: uncharacterized protein LOC109030798 [Bemisia tabaci]